jgi:hypothetical protein
MFHHKNSDLFSNFQIKSCLLNSFESYVSMTYFQELMDKILLLHECLTFCFSNDTILKDYGSMSW